MYITVQNKDVPLIPSTKEQMNALNNNYFRQLLLALGLSLKTDQECVYPRIPHVWTPKQLMDKATSLGKIDPGWLNI